MPANPTRDDRWQPLSVTRRAALTVGSVGGLVALYAGYAAAMRPLLEPAAPSVSDRPVADAAAAPAAGSTLAARHLPFAPWAAGPDVIRVTTGQAVLFAGAWGPTDDPAVLRLAPFAMVLKPDGEDGSGPDVVPTTVTAEAAVVKFERAVDAGGMRSPGRIVLARFDGVTRVDGAEGLHLSGRNFGFSEESLRLFSDEPVAFRHAGHAGTGRGVQVELFRLDEPDTFDTLAVSGVERLRVYGPITADLAGGAFPDLGEVPGMTDDAPARNSPTPAAAPVRVTSAGSFLFDPRANLATLEKEVVVSRPDGAGGEDRLTADLLSVAFAPSTPAAKAAADERRTRLARGVADPDVPFEGIDGDLEATRLTASGTREDGTPGGTVTITSPSRGVTVVAGELTHDLASRVTTLTGGTDAAGRPRDVTLTRGADRLTCPSLTLLPESNAAPRRVTCAGPGRLTHADAPGGPPRLSASWVRAMTTTRDPLTGRDRVTLEGLNPDRPPSAAADATVKPPPPAEQVVVQQRGVGADADGAAMLGDRIVLDLERGVADGAAAGPENDTRITPRRLRATGLVRLYSPDLEVRTGELLTEFLPTDAGDAPGVSRVTPGGGVEPRRSFGFGLGADDDAADEDGARIPLRLSAGRVAVTVGMPAGGGDPFPQSATAEGDAVLFRRESPDVPPDLVLRGERMVLTADGPGRERLVVHGRPAGPDGGGESVKASLQAGGTDLLGMTVRFDRAANTADVDGEGRITLPVGDGGGAGDGADAGLGLLGGGSSADPSAADPSAGNTAAGPSVAETAVAAGPRRLTVHWGEGMHFDGRTAHFTGAARTRLDGTQLSCRTMSVTLTEAVSFADPAAARGAEVAGVECDGRVRIDGYAFAPSAGTRADAAGTAAGAGGEPEPVERRAGEFARLKIDRLSGDVTAQGPGELSLWRKGAKNRIGPAPAGTVRANTPVERRAAPAWELTTVTFEREVAGNLHEARTVFGPTGRGGRVVVLHGPVPGRESVLDPYDLPVGGGSLRCDTLTIVREPGGEDAGAGGRPTVNLIAEGGAELAGRNGAGVFDADAERIVYNQAKELYRLSAAPGGTVVLYRRAHAETAPDTHEARELLFFPAQNRFESVGMTGTRVGR